MYRQDAMALYSESIKSGNTARFIDELNSTNTYSFLDEPTEKILILYGNKEMLEYYLKSHLIWWVNEVLFKERWPELYAKYKTGFAK